ncbi:hypothetical protein D3C85_1714240 [compost metagenome]
MLGEIESPLDRYRQLFPVRGDFSNDWHVMASLSLRNLLVQGLALGRGWSKNEHCSGPEIAIAGKPRSHANDAKPVWLARDER